MTAPDDSSERELLSVAGELQLFVNNDLPEQQAIALHERGFDEAGFETPLIAAHYANRLIRRVLWGAGMYTLTERRIIGAAWDNEAKASTDDFEAAANHVCSANFPSLADIEALGPDRSPEDEATKLVIPRERKTIDELAKLTPPESKAQAFAEFLRALREEVSALERDPARFGEDGGDGVFARSEQRAEALGIGDC